MSVRHGLGLLGLWAACASCAVRPTAEVRPAPPAAVYRAPDPAHAEIAGSIEPWAADGEPGRVIVTRHYRLHTTIADAERARRLAAVLEHALPIYRAGCGVLPEASLPEPPRTLDVFVYRTRGQWDLATRRLLGEAAAPLLAMPRGGYTIAGRVMLYDVGRRETVALLAHEGWHQYVQSTFARSLPDWLDEGLATIMEGVRWAPGADGAMEITFSPWANTERFDELRRAATMRRLLTLDRLVSAGPTLTSAGADGDALAYYAQAWALVHYLREGRGGEHAAALGEMVTHAARAGGASLSVAPPASGVAALRERFGPLGPLEAELDGFVRLITRPGARELIVQGRSPAHAGDDPRRAD